MQKEKIGSLNYHGVSKASVNIKLLAPCGLCCGVCGIYYADKNNIEKLKQKLAQSYLTEPEQIKCDGCSSDNKFVYCDSCLIRECVLSKGLSGCHQCTEWPCEKVTNFPFPLAGEYMLKSIPARRERTDKEWVEWEEHNWSCRECGTLAFRGARICGKCRKEIPSILRK